MQIDHSTIELAWDKDANDWKRNTTGKLEYKFIDRSVAGGRTRYASTRLTDVAQAQAFVKQLKGDLRENAIDKFVEPIYAELVELYIGSATFKANVKKYRHKASATLRAFGDRRLSSLSYEDIDQFCAERKRTCDASTLRNDLGVLMTCRRFAIKRRYIPKEKIGDLIEIDRPPEKQWSDRRALTETQTDELWDICLAYKPHGATPDRLTRSARFGCIAIDTGARRAAIERLKWGQVNFERQYIDFRTANDPDNKRKAVCPMSPRLYEILTRAKAEAINEYVLDRPEPLPPGVWKNTLKSAGYEWVHPHLFRHSFITQSIMRGMSLDNVARIVNDDPKTIEKRYAHLQPDWLHGQMKWSAAQKQATVVPLRAAE